jgi:hypothetical protein
MSASCVYILAILYTNSVLMAAEKGGPDDAVRLVEPALIQKRSVFHVESYAM